MQVGVQWFPGLSEGAGAVGGTLSEQAGELLCPGVQIIALPLLVYAPLVPAKPATATNLQIAV